MIRTPERVPEGGEATQSAELQAKWHDDVIVIVGMACRFPGSVHSPEQLWVLIAEGRDAISSFPKNRGWDVDGVYDPTPGQRGKSYTRAGGFLYDLDQFDAGFFDIGPREAAGLDPQQRLLLETSWEALERAGVQPRALRGSRTGIFVAVAHQDCSSDWQDRRESSGHLLTGSLASVASDRIAYTLGLEGPALTVDAACSSSLTCLHLACASLRAGESTLALTGGATILATPGLFIEQSQKHALAADGRCKAFAAGADGTGFAEGVGMLVLERLSDARRHGHRVLAVIRGSALNQDGAFDASPAPDGASQERVIRQALANAGLSAADIDAVEAHGTGTAQGDPIEAQALLATYGEAHSRENPLWLGSLKSNIGHTQAAAGVGGIIKMVLAMRHGVLPKTLHAERPSPHIDWSGGTIRLLNERVSWTAHRGAERRVRRAGVSSFGRLGTNAHVILEEAPPELEEVSAALTPPLPVLLSAKSERALRAQAARLRAHLMAHPEASLVDVASSLATGRAHFEHRAGVLADDRGVLLEALEALSEGRLAPRTVLGQSHAGGKLVFVFPEQGSQWTGMALSLLESSRVFREQIEACARALAPHVTWSLLDMLRGLGSQGAVASRDRVDVVQPALFAVMVSLAAVWRGMGIEPDAVMGHGQGEVAAAYVAGALSLDDAAKIVALRSRALVGLSRHRGMVSVELGLAELEKYLRAFGTRLSIAAIHGPRSIVVSGEADAVDALLDELAAAQIFAVKSRGDSASHHAHVEAIAEAMASELAGLTPRACPVPFYSTVTGEKLDGAEMDAAYWYANLRHTVRFADAVESALSDGHARFVEVGPHPLLIPALHDILEGRGADPVAVGSLRRGDGSLGRLHLALAELHTRGQHVDWAMFFAPYGARRVELPTYAFQREPFGLGARAAVETRAQTSAPSDGERIHRLRSLVLTETAATLGHTDPSRIEADTGFFNLGLDSLTVLELRCRLQRATGVRLPASLALDLPSPHHVARFLFESLRGEKDRCAPRPTLARGARPARGSSDEPLAIVGIGLRLPAGIGDIDGLWSFLEQGRDAVVPVPESRCDADAGSVRHAALLDGIDRFDAAFFGISAQEAPHIEPQHRLLLETTWQALEDAGIVPESLEDSRTGIFVGTSAGNPASLAAGRLAFTLNLQGPALSVDTECSSSLVALHLAGQSLRRGECDVALAAGVQVMTSADDFVRTSHTRVQGYGRGEGVVVLVLERARDARARGHRILALVRGSAIQHDELSAPNGALQQKLLRAALEDAGLEPGDVDAVECDGTGTPLGDPLEVQALAAVYRDMRDGRAADRPLLLGALKTNIGHLEFASGLAGVAKVIASLHHDTWPASSHTHPRESPHEWASLPVRVPNAPRAWTRPADGRPRRAGVSSFGSTRTNAHVILEEAPVAPRTKRGATVAPSVVPVLLSGKSEEALRAQAAQLREHLAAHPALPMADVAYSLATTRSHFEHRAVLVAQERGALLDALETLAQTERTPPRSGGKVGMLFTGLGSQHAGMGRGLYDVFPVFRHAMDAVCKYFDRELEQPLRKVLFGVAGSAWLDETVYAQPALFALEVALFRLVESWGVQPDVLLGHSIGELVAAHVAGVLSLEDACTLVSARAGLMQGLARSGGAMVTLQASEAEVAARVAPRTRGVVIAAVNGPLLTVVSGDEGAVLEVARYFAARGRKTARSRGSHAFHSHHMDGMLERFGRVAQGLTFHPARIPMVSNVTGKLATDAELRSADYWVRHVRQAVRFMDGMRALEADGVTSFLELGPHGVLSALGQQALMHERAEASFHPALMHERADVESLTTALGGLHARGHRVDWGAFFAPYVASRVALPTYAFQRERCWLEARAAHQGGGGPIAHPRSSYAS